MVEPTVQEQTTMFKTVKDQMNVDAVVDNIRQSKDIILEIGIYTAVGFFTGYLIKRYSGFLATFIVSVGLLLLLNKFDIISVTVNWSYIAQQVGVQPILLNTESISVIMWEWARSNILLLTSAVVGFLLGLRIG